MINENVNPNNNNLKNLSFLDTYINIQEFGENDKERLGLNGSISSITFKSFNGKREFSEITKTTLNHFIYNLDFNESDDINQIMVLDMDENVKENVIFEYQEKNNLINIYKGFGETAEQTEQFLFSTFSYDENNRLLTEFGYRPKGGNIYATETERHKSKQWLYQNELLIEESSIGGKTKYEYDNNGLLIQKDETQTSYDGELYKSIIKYFYNSKNQLVKEIGQFISRGATDIITTFTYDHNNNLIEKKIIKPSTAPRKFIDASFQNHDKEITYVYKAEPETLISHELNSYNSNSDLISQTIFHKDVFCQVDYIYQDGVVTQKNEYNDLGEKIKVTVIKHSNSQKILEEKIYLKENEFSVRTIDYDIKDNPIKIAFVENNEVKFVKEICISYNLHYK